MSAIAGFVARCSAVGQRVEERQFFYAQPHGLYFDERQMGSLLFDPRDRDVRDGLFIELKADLLVCGANRPREIGKFIALAACADPNDMRVTFVRECTQFVERRS